MKKIAVVFGLIAVLSVQPGQAAGGGFKEHFDLGQQYLANYQYSGAVVEFKNALRINYLDNSARIGLVNAYIARGTNLANTEKNYTKAANDYRSALFYLIYYPGANSVKNSSQAIVQLTSNLNKCLSTLNFDTSAENRFQTAKQLRAEGEFAAAGYEFNQTLSDTAYIKESFAQTGDIMRLIGNDRKAAEYYKKALNMSPSDLDLRMTYARTLDKTGQETDAVREYNYVLSMVKDDKEMLYALERIYRKKLESSPTDATITSNLGAILQKQGKLDEALRYYSKAEYLDPSNITTRLNTGTLHQQKGDYKTAITAYDSVLTLYPDNLQANLYKAQALTLTGDKKGALERYRKVLALEPGNTDAQAQVAESLYATMPPAQFVDYAKKNLPGINPAEFMYSYALELHKQNKLSEAATAYNEALKLNTSNPEIYLNLAIAQAQNKNYDAAETTLTNAIVKFPGNKQLKDELGRVNSSVTDEKLDAAADLYNKGDYKNAVESYKKALVARPADSDIAYNIAAIYAKQEKWDEAKTYALKAAELNKNNKNAQELLQSLNSRENSVLFDKAAGLFDKGKYDEALPLFNQLIAKDPKNAYALYYRGMIADEGVNGKKDYNAAITDYKASLAAAGGDTGLTIVNYLLGIDYDNLNRPQDALPYFKKFVETYKENDDFKNYAVERIKQ